jgi:hypothetical protein
MPYAIVDPADFLTDGAFFEDKFVENIDRHDWNSYKDTQVLVRGCTSAIIPPWAYMILTSRLSPVAKSVRFGNEHDNIVVYRRKKVK